MTASSSSNNNCPEKNAKHDRKLRKPLIEKRRRERINCSLEQLKGIMVDAYNLDQSKLEKADVLEVTVQHMEGLQKGIGAGGVDSTASNNNNNNSTNGVGGLGLESRQRYSTGYIQCMHEVHNLLLSCPGMDKTLGAGLLNHLLQSLPHVSAADAAAAVAGCASPGSSPERGGCGAGHPRSDWSPPNGHYGAVDAMGANSNNNNRRHHHSGSSQLSSSYSSSPPTSPLSPSPRTPFSRSPFRPRRLEMHEPPAMMMMMPPQAATARHHHQRRCPPQSPASLLLPPEVTTEGSPPSPGEECAGVRDGSVLIVRPPVSSSSYSPCFTPPRRVSTPASPVAPAPSQVEDPSMWRPW